ncbi:DUF6461 domain-containing protein [Rhodococcus ruber]|uniref:DUF6461 domain-containing protein n=1 Tax=Rhodococcus ruber TaxID=1830 RepID=A0ABT4MJ37_9NOCA|nr:DUF6461 domain-containing protein [Rhodococcus ruber]MCZ4521006.1 DUF6461 domain-containing protein [Rhodococcus ruber]
MATTYRDYLWFRDEEFGGWRSNGHVVSLIRDATADGVLDALGAVGRRRTGVGYAGFGQRSTEFERLGLVRPDSGADQTVQTVGVADIGKGWVLLIQQNSDYLGVDDKLFGSVTEHHEVVSHFSNVNALSRFVWWRDGKRKVSFEPMIPTGDLERAHTASPAEAATVLALITEVGGIDLDDYHGTRTEFFHIEGSFALAERLTGVEVSKELLRSAVFTVAMVPTTGEPEDPYAHELPPRTPLLGNHTTWGEVHQLYRSAAEATVHATMVLSEPQGCTEERHEVEFLYSPFDGTRQVDAHGLLSVVSNADHWHRGPFNPITSPEGLLAIHRRWEPETPFHVAIDPTSQATPTEVSGRRAWEFVFPPGFWGGPLTVAFDAHTGIPLRAESTHRTEELSNVVLDESFSNALFIVPD